MTAPHSTIKPDDTTRKSTLSVTKVASAALAAVTAALLGSQLGAAGTVLGAAAASVITTVGTAVYHTSLERSRQQVRSLALRTRSLPVSRAGPPTGQSHSGPGIAPPGVEQPTDAVAAGAQHPQTSRHRAALRWGAAAVGAVGAFVLAMMLITGFEWASGESIGGNGTGTTLGRVVNAQPAPRHPHPATPPASSSSSPGAEAPSQRGEDPDASTSPSTSPSTPGDEPYVDRSPSETSQQPEPSEVSPAPPLLPGLPGPGE